MKAGVADMKCAVCRAVVGEVDEEIEQSLDLSAIRAPPLNPVQH